MTERTMPDAPGWWWASDRGWDVVPHCVIKDRSGRLRAVVAGYEYPVDGCLWKWLAPIPSPAELARLRVAERAARAASDVLEAHTAHADAVAAGDQDARDTAVHYHRLAMDEYREAVEAWRALDENKEVGNG